MRKIIVFADAGMCGTDGAIAMLVNDEDSDSQIDEMAWEEALEHAQMYGDLVEEYPEDDEDYDSHYIVIETISSSWADYDGDNHDGYRVGGGSFEEDFAALSR